MLEINLDLDTFISNYAIKISLESVQVAGGINFLTVQIPHSHVPGGERRELEPYCVREKTEREKVEPACHYFRIIRSDSTIRGCTPGSASRSYPGRRGVSRYVHELQRLRKREKELDAILLEFFWSSFICLVLGIWKFCHGPGCPSLIC
jgi:hypothetical protein